MRVATLPRLPHLGQTTDPGLTTRAAIAVPAAILAILAATGIPASVIFSNPTTIKYAITIAGPLLVCAICLTSDPCRALVGASIIVAPFGGLVASAGGVEISIIAPFLLAAVAVTLLVGSHTAEMSALGVCSLLALLLFVIPASLGHDIPYAELFITIGAYAYVAGRIATTPKGARFIFSCLAFAASLQGAIALWEFQTGNEFNPYRESGDAAFSSNYFFDLQGLSRPAAALPDPIALGNVLAICLPIAVVLVATSRSKWERRLLASGAVLIALGLVVTFSRMSWIGGAVGVLLAGVLLPSGARRRYFAGVAVSCVAVMIAATALAGPELSKRFDSITNPTAQTTATANGDKTRLELWSGARETGTDNLFAGVGLGELPQQLAQRGAPGGPGTHAHSTYLQLFAEAGLLGLAALGLIVLGLSRDYSAALKGGSKAILAAASGALVSVAIVWTTDYSVRYASVAAVIAVVAGVVAGQGSAQRQTVIPGARVSPHSNGRPLGSAS